jgi:hypothetical protein
MSLPKTAIVLTLAGLCPGLQSAVARMFACAGLCQLVCACVDFCEYWRRVQTYTGLVTRLARR